MKVKVYSWSHGSDCWTYFETFNSEEEVENFLKKKGYNPRYFKYDIINQ